MRRLVVAGAVGEAFVIDGGCSFVCDAFDRCVPLRIARADECDMDVICLDRCM